MGNKCIYDIAVSAQHLGFQSDCGKQTLPIDTIQQWKIGLISRAQQLKTSSFSTLTAKNKQLLPLHYVAFLFLAFSSWIITVFAVQEHAH